MKEESIIKDLYDHFDELNFGFRPSGTIYGRHAFRICGCLFHVGGRKAALYTVAMFWIATVI